ncbi:hypothetical protein [Burkholderia oklahomensis]|uniref:hypothetical protein n=1 Tax=Burkholderia oklahomensis TaxID=342113 RepID=UPI00031539DC|nr:hypothetical protein [Burkholderia oklahomensis]AJX34974.1 putative lipoprotein transmembrane [Burkholderia oklahomensis C6786]AOI48858.1 hypothetical protein WI23_23880 [Burkholderia oklahomensis C6786]KUY50540.1 hypothetical protein WI23_27365 [Burkholderia oklahomensis C6786]MBI0362937.1 hypothetical protein [Burkholderia oklahomensis]SUY27041.1 Uncharacterised protein [Burkholderia oklahomensis]
MQYVVRGKGASLTKTLAAMLFAAIGLSACGGGDDGGGASSNASAGGTAAVPAPAQSRVKIEGQSQSVLAANGYLQIVFPPVASSNYGSLVGDSVYGRIEEASLKQDAPGVYTKFSEMATLVAGTVTDLAGNGQFAIGRWTNGNDSRGNTYNANQGRLWALGTPVSVALAANQSLTCSLAAATRPFAVDGNTAPGALTGASAKVYPNPAMPTSVVYDLTFQYSIGSDTPRNVTLAALPVGLGMSRVNQYQVMSQFGGADAAKPYLLVAYTVQAPTAGAIAGVAALSCS